ncbi:uncharacterized protein LOC109806124 isoform X2 [Cajanus cajan]|nr:uncharacterized protein LOC109806124 isoform X2 [Cajanus cajan]
MYKGASKKRKLPERNFDIDLCNTRDKTAQNFHQNNSGAVETGVSSEEFVFTSLKATTKDPSRSFEFYVWSDEGINLCIDLNSSPSDWSNRYRNEVCVSLDKSAKKEFRSLWQDLGCLGGSSTQGKNSFLWSANSVCFDDCNGQTKSSQILKLAKDVTGPNQQNKGGLPSIYDSLAPCSMPVNVENNVNENKSTASAELTVNVAENLKKYESTVSDEVSFGAPNNYISGAKSCSKEVHKKILDLNATNTPFIKSICGSVGNSLSDPDTLGQKNSKPNNEIFEVCAMLNGSCPVNPDMMCPGALLSDSLEVKVSEVTSCHKYLSLSHSENNGFLDLSDPKNASDVERGLLVNSSELNLDTNGKNLPSLTEEWEVVGKNVNGRESSEYSQFDDPPKKSSQECSDQKSGVKLRQKRKHIHSEAKSSSDKPVAMFLRSMKNAMTVQPRRSMRLISKVP